MPTISQQIKFRTNLYKKYLSWHGITELIEAIWETGNLRLYKADGITSSIYILQ